MVAGREDHMMILGKTKSISVEKHSMSMVVSNNTVGVVLKKTICKVS